MGMIERIDPVISRGGISFDRDVRLYALPGGIGRNDDYGQHNCCHSGCAIESQPERPYCGSFKGGKADWIWRLATACTVHNHSQESDDLARTFDRMAADLEHAETLRNNMLADISHELRTPLAVLSGQLRPA